MVPTRKSSGRGKQVSFELPKAWQGAPEEEGNGSIYWHPDHEGAALRLSVLTFEIPEREGSEGHGFPSSVVAKSGPIEPLGPGHWFTKVVGTSTDKDGEFSFISYYHSIIRERTALIVIFSASDFPSDVEAMIDERVRAIKVHGV